MFSYYACQWLVDVKTVNLILEAVKLVKNLAGELVLLQVPLIGEEGYFTMVFGLRLPSDAAMEIFREKIAAPMGLQSCYSIDELMFREDYGNLTTLLDEDEENLYRIIAKIRWEGRRNVEFYLEKIGLSIFARSIEELDLSSINLRKLKNVEIVTLGDVLYILRRGWDFFSQFRGFDDELFAELAKKVTEKGYWPRGEYYLEELELDAVTQKGLVDCGLVTRTVLVELLMREGREFFRDKLEMNETALEHLLGRLRELGDLPDTT
jgi:hypothetical protein